MQEGGQVAMKKKGEPSEAKANQLTEAAETQENQQKAEAEVGEDEENMFEDDGEEDEDVFGEEEDTSREAMLKKLKEKIQDRDTYRKQDIKVEYDEDAYIKTYGERIKRIEFLGFDKIWERLYDLHKMTHMCISNQKVAHFGILGQLGKICPNLTDLAIEDNLLCSWDQIFILGHELRKLNVLAISRNKLRIEDMENGVDLSKLKSYNAGNEILTSELAKEDVFPRLTNLIMIDTDLTFTKLNLVMPYFQNITELIICNNRCNDFDKIDFSLFQNIERINLENNQIDTKKGHQVELLTQIPKLEMLSLLKNRVKAFKNPEKFTALKNLNVSSNLFNTVTKSLTVFGKIPNLETLRFKHNPYSSSENINHLLQWATAECSKLRQYDGRRIYKSDRADAEYYLMRFAFHEYFRIFKKDQFTYKYVDFKKWAKKIYPTAIKLVEKYENPYPELDKEKLNGEEMGMQPGAIKRVKINYIKVSFICMFGEHLGKKPTRKKYPITTDFLYIRNWVKQFFKAKNKEDIVFKARSREGDPYELIDDLTKGLDFYGLKDGSEILVEMKDEAQEEKKE